MGDALIIDAVAATQNGLFVTENVPGKADARSPVVRVKAGFGHAVRYPTHAGAGKVEVFRNGKLRRRSLKLAIPFGQNGLPIEEKQLGGGGTDGAPPLVWFSPRSAGLTRLLVEIKAEAIVSGKEK